jgi:DNA-binding response OmpR family regulator
MKKIMIIDESALFRDYISNKLQAYNFNVIEGKSGLEGIVKMRNEMPDLVIMDYFLSRKSSTEVLQEKKNNPNTQSIPVIMVSSKIDKSKLVEIAKFGVKKFFSKPIKIDTLLKTISELLNVQLEIDNTPCIIEAHFNDDILFIEIAQGLNKEKIELLKYKLTELLELYQVKTPKVLIMMSNIELSSDDSGKLQYLLNTILEHGSTKPKFMKILTNSDFVKQYIASRDDFAEIGVANNLNEAMDDLLGLKPDEYAHDDVVRSKLLTSSAPKKEKEESFQLRFEDQKVESVEEKLDSLGQNVTIAVVDDDIVIQELVKTVFSETGWKMQVYENGKQFVDDIANKPFDLVFLDLMMPEMNGFQVMQHLKENNIDVPVIVFSALSRKETVVKAVSFGIHSYMIKPLKPELIIQKTAEVLGRSF